MLRGTGQEINRHFARMARLEEQYPETRFPGKPGMKPSRPPWRHFWVATEDTAPCQTTTLVLCGKEQANHKVSWTKDASEVTCPRCIEELRK